MTHTTQPQAPDAGAVTAQYDFWQADAAGNKLFSVRAGVPMVHAFDQLSCLVSSSIAAVEAMATDGVEPESIPGALWQSVQQLNLAYALIQSMHGGQIAHLKGGQP